MHFDEATDRFRLSYAAVREYSHLTAETKSSAREHVCSSSVVFSHDAAECSTAVLRDIPHTFKAAHNLLSAACRYCTSIAEDNAVVNDPDAGPREKVAARLLRIEKTILNGEPFNIS